MCWARRKTAVKMTVSYCIKATNSQILIQRIFYIVKYIWGGTVMRKMTIEKSLYINSVNSIKRLFILHAHRFSKNARIVRFMNVMQLYDLRLQSWPVDCANLIWIAIESKWNLTAVILWFLVWCCQGWT